MSKEAEDAMQAMVCQVLKIKPIDLPLWLPRLQIVKLPGGGLAVYRDQEYSQPLFVMKPGAYMWTPDGRWAYQHPVLRGTEAQDEVNRIVVYSRLSAEEQQQIPPDKRPY